MEEKTEEREHKELGMCIFSVAFDLVFCVQNSV